MLPMQRIKKKRVINGTEVTGKNEIWQIQPLERGLVKGVGVQSSSPAPPAPTLWLDKSKMITLVCVQGGLRKSSFTAR